MATDRHNEQAQIQFANKIDHESNKTKRTRQEIVRQKIIYGV